LSSSAACLLMPVCNGSHTQQAREFTVTQTNTAGSATAVLHDGGGLN
jgi:hypothetical protein